MMPQRFMMQLREEMKKGKKRNLIFDQQSVSNDDRRVKE